MIIIEINNVDYELAESWEDITLRKYNEILKLEMGIADYKSNIQYNIDLFSVLMCCDKSVIEELDINDFSDLKKLCDWIAVIPEGKDIKYITIGEVTYAFPKDLNNLTLGETASLETIIGNDGSNLEKILAILLRPASFVKDSETGKEEWIAMKFDIKNFGYRQELFLDNLKITDVINFNSFFLSGEKQSSTTTKATSVSGKLKVKKMKKVDAVD